VNKGGSVLAVRDLSGDGPPQIVTETLNFKLTTLLVCVL